jgi:hypothetical protein
MFGRYFSSGDGENGRNPAEVIRCAAFIPPEINPFELAASFRHHATAMPNPPKNPGIRGNRQRDVGADFF